MKEKKSKFFKKKSFWIILFVALLVGIFSYNKLILSKRGKSETTEVKRGKVEEVLTLSGEIKADEYAKLTFPTAGEISWVGVKEGDVVKKGQGLTKLNTIVLNAAYQQARATLRAAEATVANIHDQVQDHDSNETFAQRDLRTSAEAAKDRAYEAYVAAGYNLRNATLTAPFAGILTSLAHPFPGVNVLPTETQAEIINPDTMYFDVSADQSDVMKLHTGQEVKITLDSISDTTLNGKIVFIGYTPKADELGTIYKVKVAFDNALDIKKFRIGLTGDANFITSSKDDVLYVPPKYIKSDITGKYVRKSLKNGKTYIQVGLEGENTTEIISNDVKEGDVIFD